MVTEFGADEGQTVLKAFAQVLQKHSRVNDIIGRVGSDEFGMILPHTTKEGAAIEAERLRRMIESADFTKVIKSFPHLTISIGVSEYPSVCRDADELFQTADEALFQVRERQNKVCLAQAPEAFEPDFFVKEKSI
jgi:diguanylate cyclase (GGDEF)-like protein